MATHFREEIAISQAEHFLLGSHFYLRQKRIDLVEQLKTLPDAARYIRFYCDTLISDSIVDRTLTLRLPSKIRSLHVYARSFLHDDSSIPQFVVIEPSNGSKQQIQVFFQDAPRNLFVRGARCDGAVALVHDEAHCRAGLGHIESTIPHSHIAALCSPATPGDHINGEKPANLLEYQNGTRVLVDRQKFAQLAEAAEKVVADAPPTAEEAYLGRSLTFSQSTPLQVDVVENVSPHELRGPLLGDLHAFMGDMKKTDNLNKLLNQIFSWACEGVLSNSERVLNRVISQLRFVVRCSRSSASLIGLGRNSQKLLDRLELPRRLIEGGAKTDDVPVFFVPIKTPKVYHDSLSTPVSRLQTMEKTIQDELREQKLGDQFTELFSVVIKEMGKSANQPIESQANEEAVVDAATDCEQKRRDMESYVEATQKAMWAFEEGMVEYRKGEDAKLIKELVKAGGEVAFIIVVAVASGGTAAPLAAGPIADAGKKIAEHTKKDSKVKEAFKKLWEAGKKIAPKLEQAYKNQGLIQLDLIVMDNDKFKSIKKVKEVLTGKMRDGAAKNTAQTMAMDASAPVDFLGILADWEEFDLAIDSVFQSLKDEIGPDGRIPGMEDYRLALKAQVVRGRTLVAAMRHLKDRADFHRRQEFERRSGAAREKELNAIADAIHGDNAVSSSSLSSSSSSEADRAAARRALRWARHAAYRGLRRDLCVRFHEAILSLVYDTNDRSVIEGVLYAPGAAAPPPAEAGPLVRGFRDPEELWADDFVGMLDRFGLERIAKTRPVVRDRRTDRLSTAEGWTGDLAIDAVFEEDWKDRLLREGKLYFSVPADALASTRSWRRARIVEPKIDFKGLRLTAEAAASKFTTVDDMEPVQWVWEMSQRFVDRDRGGDLVQYYFQEPMPLEQKGGVGTFDNSNGELPDLALFCRGCIKFLNVGIDKHPVSRKLKEGTDEAVTTGAQESVASTQGPIQGLDFSGVTEVVLSFSCSINSTERKW